MPLRIYNTLSGRKEELIPLHGNKIGMYVCGVTVYDLCHIGHARSAIVFDIIYRYLRSQGYEVTFVRNFTDIDDKIIKRANEEGVDYKTIAERYIKEFYADMGRLGLERPTVEPKATDHIPEMIHLISTLIQKGYAYVRDGDVFFAVEKFKDYGKLSKRNLEEMKAGVRVEIDEKKENPLDFALWKASKPGEPFWESPWGKGRPGWHIECSVMSQKHLGETFEIHGGGKDLIFPHHENEIAQSEAATGKPFALYWIHNGFVNIHKEKMSKSLGNILTIKELLKDWHPEVLRLFFLSHHYRSPVDYSEEGLKESQVALDRFYSTLKEIKEKTSLSSGEEISKDSPLKKEAPREESLLKELAERIESFSVRFNEAMDDDFNTAQALGYFHDLQRSLNTLLDLYPKKPFPEILSLLSMGYQHFKKMGWVLGLFQEEPETYLQVQRERGLKKLGLTEKEVLELVEERDQARKKRDWKKADEIRSLLLSKGIVLEDTPSGTLWRISSPT